MPDRPYVLVVDDDPDARVLMTELVASLGFPFQAADDGVEALALIEQQLPGFLILDLMMPNLDGFTVLGRLKLDADKRDIPVLILTGVPISAEKERDLRTIVLDVIRKGDVDLDRIGRLIKESIKAA